MHRTATHSRLAAIAGITGAIWATMNVGMFFVLVAGTAWAMLTVTVEALRS